MLLETSVTNGHNHFGILNDNDEGQTTMAPDGHTHNILRLPDGTIQVEPTNNHSHTAEEIKNNVPSAIEQKEFADVFDKFKLADEFEKDFRTGVKDHQAMYSGQQWSAQALATLRSKKIPALTINTLTSMVCAIRGLHYANESDIQIYPVKGDDKVMANLVGAAMQTILDLQHFSVHKDKVLEDQCVVARGVYRVYLDMWSDPEGPEIKVCRAPILDTYFLPHAMNDLSDCRGCFTTAWYSEEEIRDAFPNRAQEIISDVSVLVADAGSVTHTDLPDPYNHTPSEFKGSIFLEDKVNRKIRVMDFEEKRLITTVVVTQSGKEGGLKDILVQPPAGFVKHMQTIPEIKIVESKSRVIVVTRLAGRKIIQKTITDHKYFSAAPAYAVKVDKRLYGVIEAGTDPQKLRNKIESQTQAILARTASPATYVYRNSMIPSELNRFYAERGVPGYAGMIEAGQQAPITQPTAGVPSELITLGTSAHQNIQDTTGVSSTLMGQIKDRESGIASLRARRQNLIVLEPLFQNHRVALHLVACKMLEFLPVYTPERLASLLCSGSLPATRKKTIDPEEKKVLADFTYEQIVEVLKELKAHTLKVITSDAPHSPSYREGMASAVLEAVHEGMLPTSVAAEMWMDYLDIPNVDKYVLKLQQETAQSSSEKTTDAQAQVVSSSKNEDRKDAFLVKTGLIQPPQQQPGAGGF